MSSRWFEQLAVFDLETTGIDVETARIVTASIGVLDVTGACVERWDWLADPGIDIPAQASAVHGVSTSRARTEGRPTADVVTEIIATLRMLLERGLPLTIYNAPYDLTLLNREALRNGIRPLENPLPVIDPLVIDRAVDRYRKGKRTLAVAAQHYGVRLTDAHEASADAVAAGRVAQALARAFAEELDVAPESLHAMQVGWCRQQSENFQDYMRRTRDPLFTSSGAWPERGV
ncbi:3'-5' exonuclease [Planctomonas psychrotolerans]|uniref:3'-5' exonuclease n=1 Tax=Planctomonas psychrotolerans TaxID=2528712 RepID=UPI001239B333|nr:3'-5' exonuclease [Planctomonas psychrotolerans]